MPDIVQIDRVPQERDRGAVGRDLGKEPTCQGDGGAIFLPEEDRPAAFVDARAGSYRLKGQEVRPMLRVDRSPALRVRGAFTSRRTSDPFRCHG